MNQKGFTLVELVVVIAILGLILSTTVTLLNPSKQIDKANVAKKQSDLEQIKTALDLYYDDHGCYPQGLNFGTEFSYSTTVYMTQVPQSDKTSEPYKYEVTGDCPQWYVLYAKYSVSNSPLMISCPLNCRPPDDRKNHLCAYGGTVDCSYISSTPLGD